MMLKFIEFYHSFLEITRYVLMITVNRLLHMLSYSYTIQQQMQQTLPRPINSQYAIVESHLLGKGSTGNVYLGFQRGQPHHQVAIKVINLTEIDNEVTRYLLNCEVAALSNLGKRENTAHDNIVRLFDIVRHDQFIYLVTEILEGGTLANYIQRHPNGLAEEEALNIFRQIVEGYRHMRLRNVVHRDLKPDNVLFRFNPEHSKRVAIIDFGYCEMAEIPNKPQMYYNVGSPKYMSPEAFQNNRYSQKSDVWALGVMLYEMLIGKTCDVGMGMEEYMEMVRANGIPLPQHLSPFIRHLLSSVLAYSPQTRYDCHQILKELDAYQTGHLTQSSIVATSDRRKQIQTEAKRENKLPQISLIPSPVKSKIVFQSMVRQFEQTKVVTNQLNAPLNATIDKKLLKSNTIVNVSNPPTNQREIVSANQILGRVQNINGGSARQIVHRKQLDQGFHQPQNIQIPQPPPQPPQPFTIQKNRLLIQTRNLSANQPTGPLTPVSVPARQLLSFSTINNIVNDPNNSLRSTMPAQIQNLAIENARRAQRSQTNTQIDENNQMSPYQNKPNGPLTAQKPGNAVTKKVQFLTQKRLFYNEVKEPMVMRSTIGPPPVSEFRLSSNYPQQKNMSMPNIPQIRLFRHGFTN